MPARSAPHPVLSAALVRRSPRPLRPRAAVPPPIAALLPPAPSGWADDLRFFATCYLAGVIFFLIMLS